jgi:hypothetical protein
MRSRKLSRALPCIMETLEERTLLTTVFVVPLTVATDSTHVHSLNNAINAALAGDVIQTEPGSVPEASSEVPNVKTAITIQGDPATPANIDPSTDLKILANNVTLVNLNLGTVTINAGFHGLNVHDCLIRNLTETSATTGNGSNNIVRNQFSNSLGLLGNTDGSVSNDVVADNHFVTTADTAFFINGVNAADIHGNTLDSNGFNGIEVTNGTNINIHNNTIRLEGNGEAIGVTVTGVATASVTIRNNVLATFSKGTGLDFSSVDAGMSDSITATVEGNDFHGNATGIVIETPSGVTAALDLDFGGGGRSLGGNNFRSFTGLANSSLAIKDIAPSSGTIHAQSNLFASGLTPANVVEDSHNGGSGTIDTTNALDANHAYIQTLYEQFLGRAGAASELNFWVGRLAVIGRSGVANGIARSQEAFSDIVESFYVHFLHRASDAGGKASFVGALLNGNTIEAVVDTFLGSPEYAARINIDFTQSLYIELLRRTGSIPELNNFNAAHPDRITEANIFLQSPEYRGIIVKDYYLNLLHRTPSNAEVAFWVNSGLDLYSIEIQFITSDEFVANR